MGGRGGSGPAGTSAPATTPAAPATPNWTPVQRAMIEIGQAYRGLANSPRDFVRLTDLRSMLSGEFPREVVDEALRALNNMKGNNISPQSNQKILTDRDRAAMVRIGGENRLLISMSNFDRPS